MIKKTYTNTLGFQFDPTRKNAKYTIDGVKWMNHGEFCEVLAKHCLGYEAKKDGNTAFNAGADIPELNASVKSIRCGLTDMKLGNDPEIWWERFWKMADETQIAIWVCEHDEEVDLWFMSHEEFKLGEVILRHMMAGKDLNLAATIHMETGSTIDLGGRTLEIFHIPGHTPGSIAVYDDKDDLLFTGDAIGSGCGVWMQLPGSSSLAEYEQSLLHFQKWLMARSTFPQFWGGHYLQRWSSAKVPDDNPVTMGLLADLIELVHGLIHGGIAGWHIEMPEYFRAGKEARNAAFGRAEITYNPDYLQ